MSDAASGAPPRDTGGPMLRLGAAGGIQCSESTGAKTAQEIGGIPGTGRLILLAADLTTHGEPEQAAVLADACRNLETPVIAVLGNHDWHSNRAREVGAVLEEAGVTVLDRSATTCNAGACGVGVVGV